MNTLRKVIFTTKTLKHKIPLKQFFNYLSFAIPVPVHACQTIGRKFGEIVT